METDSESAKHYGSAAKLWDRANHFCGPHVPAGQLHRLARACATGRQKLAAESLPSGVPRLTFRPQQAVRNPTLATIPLVDRSRVKVLSPRVLRGSQIAGRCGQP